MRLLCHLAIFLAMAAATQGGDAPLFRSAFPLDALRSVNQADAKVAAEILIRRIVEREGYAYTTVIPRTHSEFLTGLNQDRYDFYLMFGYEYLRSRETVGMKPTLVGVRDGKNPLNELLLLVHGDRGLDAAKGGKLVVERGSGELPMMWLEEEFAERGMPEPASYFGTIEETDGTGKTILSVFFGKAAACIITREAFELMAELNPQLERKLTVAAASEPLLTTVMCLSEEFQEINPGTIERIGVQLHERPDGSQILTLMRVGRLVKFEPHLSKSLETLLAKRAARLAP